MSKSIHSILRKGLAATSGFALLVAGLWLGSSMSATGAEMLTGKQLASLQEARVVSNRNVVIMFTAHASQTSTEQGVRPKRNAKIPYVIQCSLDEIKEVNGRKLSKRLNGSVEIRVLDSNQKVVDSSRQALEKMCAA